jgi:hypothetical protein
MRLRRLCGVLAALATLWLASATDVWRAQAQPPNRVGLVVTHGDGSTTTRCISFSEPDISGYDVLQRSGLDVVVAQSGGVGAAICAIEGEGCGATDCFCQCQGNPCIYWTYWHLNQGTWIYSSLGASSHRVRNGDVEGWRWGGGDPPPVIPFDQICTAPPTDTPAPTPTPIPATSTPLPPTATPLPPSVWFRLDANPIGADTCTFLRWDTSNVTEAYLDGERVPTSGSREVCPAAPQEYRLRVVGPGGEQIHRLTLGVAGTPQPSPSATVAANPPTIPPTGTPIVPRTPVPTPTMTAAAGATAFPTQTATSEGKIGTDTPAPSAAPAATRSAPNRAPTPTEEGAPQGRSGMWIGYVGLAVIAASLIGLAISLAGRRK